ncbi:ABC transporter permease [Roseomonas fluvialis]|nr:ABC transporter permease [Roseomonas fluvialis]
MRTQKLMVGFAIVVLALYVLAAVGADWLVPFDPANQQIPMRLKPPGTEGPGGVHWFGTDALGRDILSMVLVATRPALLVSFSATAVAATVGVLLGGLAGYRGGRVATALLTLTNIQLSFPFFLLAITIVGILTPSTSLVVLVIALGTWVPFARVSYSETLQIREQEYIEAVRVMRGSHTRILWRHVLPGIMPSIIVLCTFEIAAAIVIEAGLSFVGLGVPTRTPTWGRMLSEGRDYMHGAWWMTVIPGIAIVLLALCVNLVGEHLRDVADPRQRRR